MSSSNNVATTSTDPNAINNVAMTAHVPQNNLGTNEVLLATALVKVASGNGSYHILRALIDPGSQVSLIKESTAKKLGLRKSKFNGLVCGVGEVEQNCKGMVTLNCSSTHNDFSFITDVLIMKNVLKDIPHKSFDTPKWSYIDSLKLADPYFNISRPVDLLLSAQVIGLILMGGLIKGENASQPVLQETQLGWIIYGGGQIASLQCNVVMNNVQDIQHFWDIEDITEKSNLSLEDQECADFYSSTTKRREDGRYIVKLPLKAKINEKIGSSKELAIAQFQNLERSAGADIEVAAISLCLHCRYRENVPSLRNMDLQELIFQYQLLQILLWRQYLYAYTSDIEKMYRQIMVDEADQQYQQIIWRFEPSQPLQTYKLTTVTNGTKSAPFLAMMTSKRLAMDEQSTYPEAAKILEESFYMDDLVHGFHSITKGKQLIEDLNRLLKSGGFTLRKWSANHPELLENIKQNSSNSEIIFNFKSESWNYVEHIC
ncbi:uncharacterized protein LOC111361110 [Spodoptera litura]|uniref:Uncharacterized protein LOC111361110 n=1 Tax=Spodoptera litura TaxID=69820 RepID=A0A9J7IY91_SPOLT|nr:uncharacterized protein LOC111361110 [Spodoptera litura]